MTAFQRGLVAGLLAAFAVSLALPGGAAAKTRHVWVVAEPARWNAVPNGLDAIHGTRFDPSQTIFPTVTYRRYTRRWRRPMAPDRAHGTGRIPGPLIKAREGDTVKVHFKNLDDLRRAEHSMHFHGFDYSPRSDGAYVPGFSGRDARVKVGQSVVYTLHADRGSAGVWPYHDHSTSMEESIAGGMYGAISIAGRHERRADREFVVMFSRFGTFQTVNARAFVGNTPVFHARVGETIQWDVLAMGDEHHTFHVHGHKWREPTGVPMDTKTLGPAESFRVRWREDAPGTWLYHCHVEAHMAQGMIGLYRVRR
jgi:FtsP/CotA-like multicopper oxidase with cupredoxin domain